MEEINKLEEEKKALIDKVIMINEFSNLNPYVLSYRMCKSQLDLTIKTPLEDFNLNEGNYPLLQKAKTIALEALTLIENRRIERLNKSLFSSRQLCATF